MSDKGDDFTPPYIYVGLCDEQSVAGLPECDAHVRDYYWQERPAPAGVVTDEATGETTLYYSGANIGEWAAVVILRNYP